MTRYLVELAEMETSLGVWRYNDLLAMVYHVLGYQCDYLVCAFTWCTLSVSSDLNVLSQLVQLYNSVECFLEWRQRLDWNWKRLKQIWHWCRLLSSSSTCIVRWSTNAPLLSALNPQMSHLYLSLPDSLAFAFLDLFVERNSYHTHHTRMGKSLLADDIGGASMYPSRRRFCCSTSTDPVWSDVTLAAVVSFCF